MLAYLTFPLHATDTVFPSWVAQVQLTTVNRLAPHSFLCLLMSLGRTQARATFYKPSQTI